MSKKDDAGALPPWDDRERLKAWTIRKLDEADGVFDCEASEGPPTDVGHEPDVQVPRTPELELMQLKARLNAPRRGRGRPPDRLDPINDVIKDIPRIKAVWNEYYGRQNRRTHDDSADTLRAEIAAERYLRRVRDRINKGEVHKLVGRIQEQIKQAKSRRQGARRR